MKKFGFLILMLIVCHSFANENIDLQLKKKVIQLGTEKLIVEIADFPKAREKGLMFRKSLKKNHGMLFIFDKSEYLSFWMKNTYIPLDIGFFDENKELIEYHTMKPLTLETTDCSQLAKYVLEVNKGWFKQKQIKSGTEFRFINKKE